MGNARRVYRVWLEATEDLSVSCLKPGGEDDLDEFVQGTIVDLTAKGMGIFFISEAECSPPLNESTQLKFESQHLPQPILTAAILRSRGQLAGGIVYGFEFVDGPAFLASLPPQLAALFNQRGNYRVEPDPEEPVKVKVTPVFPAVMFLAVLRDFSARGLSFRLSPERAQLIAGLKKVDVAFHLPAVREEFQFHGSIVHSETRPEGIVCGVCFNAALTKDFRRKQNKLLNLVRAARKEAEEAFAL